MRTPLLLCTALLGCACALPSPATAQQIRHCETMEGQSVYTDKRCEDIGAMDALPRTAAPPAGNVGSYASPTSTLRSACARTLSDLVYQITSAIDTHDVNRLAGVYQWVGVSDASANQVLDKLEAIVDRPLLDVVPIRPAPQPVTDELGTVIDDNEDGFYPQATRQAKPVGLKLMQTSKNGKTTVTTNLSLRRNFNCFWVSL